MILLSERTDAKYGFVYKYYYFPEDNAVYSIKSSEQGKWRSIVIPESQYFFDLCCLGMFSVFCIIFGYSIKQNKSLLLVSLLLELLFILYDYFKLRLKRTEQKEHFVREYGTKESENKMKMSVLTTDRKRNVGTTRFYAFLLLWTLVLAAAIYTSTKDAETILVIPSCILLLYRTSVNGQLISRY